MQLFSINVYVFILFLAFLHKISKNCYLTDYKTYRFCIIFYSCMGQKIGMPLHPLINKKQLDKKFKLIHI